MARDYEKERKYDSQPEVMAKRAARNRARTMAINAGIIKKGDPRDVDHKNGNALSNKLSNLRAESKHGNRSYARTKTAGKKNPKD